MRAVPLEKGSGRPPAPKPTTESVLLSRLLKCGCTEKTVEGAHRCFYCGVHAWDGNEQLHRPGCPYEDAITLYGDPNAQGGPLGVLKA